MWPFLQSYQPSKDGRQGYFAAHDHYLGQSYQLRTRAKANTIIARCFYDGCSRNFTLDKYFSKLRSAFNDLPDNEVPTQRKMEIMLHGLRDSTLAATKNTVTATPRLNTSYELAVNYIMEQDDRLCQDRAQRGNQRNIAGLDVGAEVGSGRGCGRGRGG